MIYYKKLDQQIILNIHKGVYWESEEYILTQNMLWEFSKKNQVKRILELEFKPSSQNEDLTKVSFRVDGAQNGLKVHAFAFNTLPNNYKYLLESYRYFNLESNRTQFPIKNA